MLFLIVMVLGHVFSGIGSNPTGFYLVHISIVPQKLLLVAIITQRTNVIIFILKNSNQHTFTLNYQHESSALCIRSHCAAQRPPRCSFRFRGKLELLLIFRHPGPGLHTSRPFSYSNRSPVTLQHPHSHNSISVASSLLPTPGMKNSSFLRMQMRKSLRQNVLSRLRGKVTVGTIPRVRVKVPLPHRVTVPLPLPRRRPTNSILPMRLTLTSSTFN